MNHKIYILKTDLERKGLFYVLKELTLFLFRPLVNLTNRSEFLVNLKFGVIPNLFEKIPFLKRDQKILELPKTELVRSVRKFWYSNTPGNFKVDGENISRKDIFTYGGPNPELTCPICQKSEWLSRVRQKNLFVSHSCSQAKKCEELCKKQGDELWTHFHQNFNFAIGCDHSLPAPKCLFLSMTSDEEFESFLTPRCDQGNLIGRRRLDYICQRDIAQKPVGIDWSKYDMIFMGNEGNNVRFSRPNVPIILYGHDFYLKNKGYQWVINWVKPDIFLTSYPSPWKKNFKFPSNTRIVFCPIFPSNFFTRSKVNDKEIDLLVIGTTASSVYEPRVKLAKQIFQLADRYRIELSDALGYLGGKWKGETLHFDPITREPVRFLNKWSEYLSRAKYIIFGRIADPQKQFLVFKYYEVLGSGAIPILPEIEDLKLLNVKPFKHYIPLSEVEGDNEKLSYYLANYDKFSYIARNAAEWYKNNSDKMLFDSFECLIREITNYKYPKRLI